VEESGKNHKRIRGIIEDAKHRLENNLKKSFERDILQKMNVENESFQFLN
jgi:hypothetical protein